MFGVERTLLVFKFSLLIGNWISFWIFFLLLTMSKTRAGQKLELVSRDTATSINMRVDLDIDPTYSIILYKSLVRPHLEYAYPVWASVKEKDLIKIDRIQRTALLKASGCLNPTPTSALEVLTNVLPIRLRLQELLCYEYIRLLRKEDHR